MSLISLRDGTFDYVTKPASGARINWTTGYMSATASVPLPRIVNDRNDREFGQPGTARNLSQARAMAHMQARRRARRRLIQVVGGVQMDSQFTLLQKLQKDRRLRQRFGTISSLFRVRSRRTGEGRVSVELAVPFRGPGGLYRLLADERYSSEPIPQAEDLPVTDPISGLVIDATQLSEFRPSLEVRLFSERGRRFYGPETITRRCAIGRGPVTFSRSREEAVRVARLGLEPYYTLAAGAIGPARTDLHLADSDVRRILGSAGGRRALRTCAVAIIVRDPGTGHRMRESSAGH